MLLTNLSFSFLFFKMDIIPSYLNKIKIYAKCQAHCLAQYLVGNWQSIQHHTWYPSSRGKPECVFYVLVALLAHTVHFQAIFMGWFWLVIGFSLLSPWRHIFLIVSSVFRTDGHSQHRIILVVRGFWRTRIMPTLVSSSRWTGRWCSNSIAWLEDKNNLFESQNFLTNSKYGHVLNNWNHPPQFLLI